METAIWAAALLVLALICIWRGERMFRLYLRAQEQKLLRRTPEDDIALREREVKVAHAEATAAEESELRRAELRLRTAEADDKAAMIEATQEERLDAERLVARAKAEAEAELAKEFARERQTAELQRLNSSPSREEEDIIDMWSRYLEACENNGVDECLNFEDFVKNLRSYRQI
jgi:flagellar biosynthesis GTPase FlhF